MKKIIKISLLILFIIFVLGITTSNAYTVGSDTTASTMLEELEKGNSLTGISHDVRDKNPYLYCINLFTMIYKDANYNKINAVKTYPQDDSTNGYAKSYILAAPGYEKNDNDNSDITPDDERQWAWYIAIGQVANTTNDLYEMATAYQNYKMTEKEATLTEGTNVKTFFDGNNTVYGPIQVEYSYGKASSGSHSDEWGGFNYAFFDENGNNISDKVKLCTLSDGEYNEVTSAKIESTGYYKVSTIDYNKKDLYVVTSDKNITKVNIKMQSNTVTYTAKVYEIEGSYYQAAASVEYCQSCKNTYRHYAGKLWYLTSSKAYQEGRSVDAAPPNSRYHYGDTMVEYVPATNKTGVYKYGTVTKIGNFGYKCSSCGTIFSSQSTARSHAASCKESTPYYYIWTYYVSHYELTNGCGAPLAGEKGSSFCGHPRPAGSYSSQELMLVDTVSGEESIDGEMDLEIGLLTSIEVTKKWEDYDNLYSLRPENLKFNIFRSIDQENWEKVRETDYTVEIESKEENTWKILISGLERVNSEGTEYYFKVEEQELTCYKASYPNGNYPEHDEDNQAMWYIDIENSLKRINLGGYVWLDGQTGIKPAVPNNGIMDDGEARLENIVVNLYYKDPIGGQISKIAETVTDKNGYYEFKDYEIGYYYVEFEYDGVHYENTISGGSSKAFETDADRNTFNGRFETITYGKAKDGTTLNYNYADRKSTLITNEEGKTTIKKEFQMTAESSLELVYVNVDNINLGLVKRGIDIALSTDVVDAEVTINGQETTYQFNKEENSLEIGTIQTSENVAYNLNLYTSDYNYRIRDYISNDQFVEEDYINSEDPVGLKTGDELKVYVKYKLNLQNQSTETTKANEVKYSYDEKYYFKGIVGGGYNVTDSGNTITINLNGLELKEGETKTLELVFEVKDNNGLSTGNFSNKAEITSYSTDKGLIDIDSQPGNFINSNEVEDDNDTAGGLTIKVPSDLTRKITGKVFDNNISQNVNDIIVQLIELKEYNGKVYEYIWQETISGSGKGLKLNADGTALVEYTYTAATGEYEFNGFIPGDYIVRFIYGDGTTYDMTGNVIKYNGQDYKSMPDSNYNKEWYNSSSYTAGASVARDNEARRLETMGYSAEVNAVKGILLKLLDNVTPDTLNETEKEVLIATYNYYYDPDITEVTSDAISKLLKEQVLKNTWMCAETSKIKVAVDTETITNTNSSTTVNGTSQNYVNNVSDINLGIELRPATKIELKKYITGFKLTASNGQTLVNAYIDVNEYLNGTIDISQKVQGIKDNLTVLNNVWQYEVAPTDINTTVDGASLEFEYTLVVKNTGDTDYLSSNLATVYNNSDIGTYKTTLTNKVAEIKGYIRSGTYRNSIGNSLGSSYYLGGTGTGKVLTEVTNIRDYVNNDLTYITSGNVEIDASAPKTHRILRPDYSMQSATINTILKTTATTGKMENNGAAVLYTVTLGKNPISSTGNLNFENYIAEVMSYTNAAGRRAMTSTPGNAEIIDHEYRDGKSHEIDEADTGRIQIGVATGDDQAINYIIIIAVAAGIALVAIGAYVVKKYILK